MGGKRQLWSVIVAVWLVALSICAAGIYTNMVDLKSTVEGISVPDIDTKISQVKTKIDDKVSTLKTEINSKISDLQGKIGNLKDKLDSKISDLQGKISDLKTKVVDLKDRVSALESQEDKVGFTDKEFKDFVCYRAKETGGEFYNHIWKVTGVNVTIDGYIKTEEYEKSKEVTFTTGSVEPDTITGTLTNDKTRTYLAFEDDYDEDIIYKEIYFETGKTDNTCDGARAVDIEWSINTPDDSKFIKGIKVKKGGEVYTWPAGFNSTNASTWANWTLYQPECVSIE